MSIKWTRNHQSVEEAFIDFMDGVPGPVPPKRAFEDRCAFYLGAMVGFRLAATGKEEEFERDIIKFFHEARSFKRAGK